ncbi:hypothetical protein OG711_00250 [Streptomyces uncialis]|uniref:hypothetical protein n=1 Tax=Streptomyces uncialis TaxID=1048205 RepID=UPI002E2F7DDC|nr:hypothetical protein [Streptomyces uncialis]
MTDYLQAVLAMLGPEEGRLTDPAAWLKLEGELGRTLPSDYKRIVDAYAPVQINGHLSLAHPASGSWNLGAEMRSTAPSGWSTRTPYRAGPSGRPADRNAGCEHRTARHGLRKPAPGPAKGPCRDQ